MHAVGARGTVALGWALYPPEDWCADPERRRKAKIPPEVAFNTKPELGVELVEGASGWKVAKAPVLGDHACGGPFPPARGRARRGDQIAAFRPMTVKR